MATQTKEKKPRITPPLFIDANQPYSMDEVAAIRRESRASTYKAIKAGTLKVFKRGKRTLCLGAELIRTAGVPS